MYSNLTDEQLVVLTFKDKEVFAVLVERYTVKLHMFLRGYFNVRNEVIQDMVQESFIRAYLHLKSFDPEKKWKAWLYTISLNVGYTIMRTPTTEDITQFENYLISDRNEEELVERTTKIYKTKKALLELKDEHNEVLTLHYLQGKEIPEIAKKKKVRTYRIKMLLDTAQRELKYKYLENDF